MPNLYFISAVDFSDKELPQSAYADSSLGEGALVTVPSYHNNARSSGSDARPYRRAAHLPANSLMDTPYAPARPMHRESTQPPRTMKRRGESRGGSRPWWELGCPLWPSLLLSQG